MLGKVLYILHLPRPGLFQMSEKLHLKIVSYNFLRKGTTTDGIKQNKIRENDWTTDNLTNNKRLFNFDNRRIETHQ